MPPVSLEEMQQDHLVMAVARALALANAAALAEDEGLGETREAVDHHDQVDVPTGSHSYASPVPSV